MNLADRVKALGACKEAVVWLREYDFPTHQAAWDACPNGYWLKWLIELGSYRWGQGDVAWMEYLRALSRPSRITRRKQFARIVRKHFPHPPRLPRAKGK